MGKYLSDSVSKDDILWFARYHGSYNVEFNKELLNKARAKKCYAEAYMILYDKELDD